MTLSLHEIGLKHGTDKATFHNYCNFYAQFFDKHRNDPVRMLEIGVWKSYSMKMWLEYFKNGEVHGIDYIPNTVPEGAHFHQVNCENESELAAFSSQCGQFDIIIDDGGHTMLQQQLAFKHLWKNVKRGGYYVIEDLHTSFMPYLKRCNKEEWPVTFDMVKALRGEQTFSSPGIDQAMLDDARTQIDKVEVYARTPDFSNSVTCVIVKNA